MDHPVPFVPLRTDPPPALATTLWIRSALAVTILATAITLMVVDVADRVGGWSWILVAVLHGGVVSLLVVWSSRAMANVEAILPPTRYGRTASGTIAGVLWVVAFAGPTAAVFVAGRAGPEFADAETFGPTSAAIVAVLTALLVAWSPFRYHLLHAQRIGAPWMTMAVWFWAPLLTFVGGAVVLALVYSERVGAARRDEGVLGVAGLYGFATGVFAWSTWRAVTVFDEVIDLRWQRWRIDWEQTLAAMVAQPAPGAEGGGALP